MTYTYYSARDIQDTDRIKRLNLINSLSGIKPANLVGTRSNAGTSNLAIISSIVHLSSNPASMGFVMRPDAEVRRHTYENIQENGYFTINQVHTGIIEKAHYTSAKFDSEVSEFDACQLTEIYHYDFEAPFVAESHLKIGLQWAESIPIKTSNTIMIVGTIQHLLIDKKAIADNGYINLEKLDAAGISGLNSYYGVKYLESFPYARVKELPDFEKKS